MRVARYHEPGLVVIDDFLPDPYAVREYALAQAFDVHEPSRHSKYQFRRAMPDALQIMWCVNAIIAVIGEHYRKFFISSAFILENQDDEQESRKRTWVHFDRWRWVGVLYLNPPSQCKGGTSFYRHKETGFSSWRQAVGQAEIDKMLARDSANEAAWEEVLKVGMLFNRLVLFDGRQFHQASCYFGQTKTDSRLFQQFTFKATSDEEDSRNA